ncbi:protocadherin beta-14-like [Latimeria chalumnae]|uniref:protocadherin beta-14-like n=1 Tax=Latimeria chalumnae TaxID=7897 RepID=UPI0006D8FF37|nr:PREDICTED: protocadherin beta-16-like [Latimeria chalumnae]|eukprot:XP_014350990.1 PREDICTED: protocadherin beta-16-like [Latimeria chalumnae]
MKTYPLFFIALKTVWAVVFGQVRYFISEELEPGTFVGNIAKDLGLDIQMVKARRLHIISEANNSYVYINVENGIALVNRKIDREQLCGQSDSCIISINILLEGPVEIHHVEVEILDVNDNAPTFSSSTLQIEILEFALPGAQFLLERAQDLDFGTNALNSYKLSFQDYFMLSINERNKENKIPELVLMKPLDREHQATHFLTLTAFDGGNPKKSGSLSIVVTVLDANDNPPVFDQQYYTVNLMENAPVGTPVIEVHATDLDDLVHGDIIYILDSNTPKRGQDLFMLNLTTGELKVNGNVDFEEAKSYELYVQAKDNGGLIAHCTILVNISDVNDNTPKLSATSVSYQVPEDSLPGIVIAVVTVSDGDSGVNGEVKCSIAPNIPFKLKPNLKKNLYTLVTNEVLDREMVSEYNITISARDAGSPSLVAEETILVKVSDINDNPPKFINPPYTVYIMENNVPGSSIYFVTAVDIDLDKNGLISYTILENQISGSSAAFFPINSNNGVIYALRSLDYEEQREFQIEVKARDAGIPSLSSNVTVHIFVLDQNDNPPMILFPLTAASTTFVEDVPRYADTRYLVTKVVAVDKDSGHNAWLSFQIIQKTNSPLYEMKPLTGEIRTTRNILKNDATVQKLIILVKDNGDPPLSATTTITIAVSDGMQDIPLLLAAYEKTNTTPEEMPSLTLYLSIAVGTVSAMFLVAIILLFSTEFASARYSVDANRVALPACFCLKRPYSGKIHRISNINFTPNGNYLEVGGTLSQMYSYRVCLSPGSSTSGFSSSNRNSAAIGIGKTVEEGSFAMMNNVAKIPESDTVSIMIPLFYS